METNALPFQPRLPSRIAGIVFWVLMLVCLIIALYFLNKSENKADINRESSTYLLAHELGIIIKQAAGGRTSNDETRQKLSDRILYFREIMGFNAVEISGYENIPEFGVPNSDDDEFEHHIINEEHDVEKQHQSSIKVYFINKEKTLAELRKNMLLAIGVGILLFGFFLRYVLRIMVTQPFITMLESAKRFTLGDESVRFNETRQDEFGYLGRFINHAIESILEQQETLVYALDKVSTSEIALMIEKETAEVTLHSITDSVLTVDQKCIVTFVNPAAEKLLGKTLDELIGKPIYEALNIVDEAFNPLVLDPVTECFKKGNIIKFPEQSSLLNEKSNLIAIEASAAPMKNDAGDLLGAVVVVQDVSHTRKLTHQLSYQASHDALTGLYNRRKFETHLQKTLTNAEVDGTQHVLLYLDLDQFKIVNDTCGHVAGDELLQQLPLLFHKVLRSGDSVARLGGDEFGVLLENCSLEKSLPIADELRQHIKDFRFVWEDKTFEIGVSIGVVAIDSENTDMTHLLGCADIACYAAKDAGRNRVHVYEESDIAVSMRQGEMQWTTRIAKALEENRFCLYRQNIISVKTADVEHVEVLLRMVDEDGSIILPGAFLPAAERFNLMVSIDRWVISHVFSLIGECTAKKDNNLATVIAINLSGDSLSSDGLLEFIYAEKEKYNVQLDRICFEITETIAISNLNHAVTFINELKQHGCMFSLDDFGSGLSSFTYLKSLPVDYLKIDGSFVRDISKDKIDKAMVKSIQQVAEAMSLKTIAEWVEDEETLGILKDLGVNFAQGNYLMAAEPIECKD